MTDKHIIINGVTYYRQQDINEGLDEEHYITEFHLLATHYNLLLEDYACKAQECEELKDKLKIYEKMFDNSEFRVALTDIRTGERDTREQRDKRLTKENECYRKALDEIERHFECRCDICRDNYGLGADCSVCWHKDIRNIISKAKGEGNDG